MDREARLEELEHYLRTYPASVAEVSYGGDAPPLVPLGTLVDEDMLGSGAIADPVLKRFVVRLQSIRPDLTDAELLVLPVPVSAGAQEVYSARLGKWLFEKRVLGREVTHASERV